jgi:hypothetical protein
MRISLFLIGLFSCCLSFAQSDESERSVWVNEAIVATYTYDHQNFLDQQKKIAHYFSTQAWINYSEAFAASKLLDTIKKNKFKVSAVAQSAPEIKALRPGQWQASMPLLVVYTNNDTEQKQTLKVTITFGQALPPGGVRGLQIESYESKVEVPSCSCNR